MNTGITYLSYCTLPVKRREKRNQKCINHQPEAFWGTTKWATRFEDIKTVIDPDGIFVAAGVLDTTTTR